jgi:hypothetical protein
MNEDLFDNLSKQLFPDKMSWGGHASDVNSIVIAAYNRAIEDAAKLAYLGYPHLDDTDQVVDLKDLLNLKIQ